VAERHPDVLVVGGGIAGLTAATALGEQGYAVTMADDLYGGGRMVNIGHVRSYPGLEQGITGPELSARCLEAALDAGVQLLPVRVLDLEQRDGAWAAHTDDGDVVSRAVVLATGRTPDLTAVPGAADFAGQGLSQCASCDGPLFAGKPVAVAGAAWWLAAEVQHLAAVTERVTVVLAGERPNGPPEAWHRVAELANVEVHTRARITELESGDQGLAAVVIDRAGQDTTRIAAHALFLFDDELPVTPGLPPGLTDATGAISAAGDGSTALAGLFAAGGVRVGSLPYLVAAAADGRRAADAASAFLAENARD
jgi:thioredoxin reductase (NADPH)